MNRAVGKENVRVEVSEAMKVVDLETSLNDYQMQHNTYSIRLLRNVDVDLDSVLRDYFRHKCEGVRRSESFVRGTPAS
jgi:hypothetical protein